MSDIPLLSGVATYVYADDIAFFAAAVDIHSLYERLQAYLSLLDTWLYSIHLTLNVSESALLVFPVAGPVSISLTYKNQVIPKVDSVKYLGITYTSTRDWHTHINASVTKAETAFGRIKRLCGKGAGMRQETLLLLYRSYKKFLPVMKFGCVLFCDCPIYKLRPLYLLERRVHRFCLGLPRFVSNRVLYLEARIPELRVQFLLLTVQTYLRMYEAASGDPKPVFIWDPSLFFISPLPKRISSQVKFVQTCLGCISVKLYEVIPLSTID